MKRNKLSEEDKKALMKAILKKEKDPWRAYTYYRMATDEDWADADELIKY
ncbi:MAG: hypothetical protein ABH821_02680 [archaeon]